MADDIVRTVDATEGARLELMQARARLAIATRALKADLQWLKVPAQVTASIKKSPLLWLGGAFAIGVMLGTFSSKEPKWKQMNPM